MSHKRAALCTLGRKGVGKRRAAANTQPPAPIRPLPRARAKQAEGYRAYQETGPRQWQRQRAHGLARRAMAMQRVGWPPVA
eukprot:14837577-Alexandrium_andersonii.AAC.1